jgi:hypothetical protein
MIHQVPGFTLRTPELLGHDEVREYEPLIKRVVNSRADCDDLARTLKLALKAAPLVVVVLEPKRAQNPNTRR